MSNSLWPPLQVVLVTPAPAAESEVYRALVSLLGVQVTRCGPTFLEIIAWIEGLDPQHVLFELARVTEECLEIVQELRRCNLKTPVALIVSELSADGRTNALSAGIDHVIEQANLDGFLREIFEWRGAYD